MQNRKTGSSTTFAIWFGMAALMFGTTCGGAMAAGTYATGYFARYGGGHLITFCLIYAVCYSFCAIMGLLITKTYGATNYKEFYLALWGLHKPTTNKVLRTLVTLFFDFFTILASLLGIAATVSLFGNMMYTIFGIPVMVGGAISILIYGFLTMYGAGFLRKANSVMTIGLVVVMLTILGCVIAKHGSTLFGMLGNFSVGSDWHDVPVSTGYSSVFTYSMTAVSVGGMVCNYAQKIRNNKDCIGAGILTGIMVTSLFFLTSCIVLPYLPVAFSEASPIITICKEFGGLISAFYWIMVLISVCSTAPTFTFSIANRFVGYWRSEKTTERTKLFVLAMAVLLVCYAMSFFGLMNIVVKGYSLVGTLGGIGAGIPLLLAIPRLIIHDRRKKVLATEE